MPRLTFYKRPDGSRHRLPEDVGIRGYFLSRHAPDDDEERCRRCGGLWPCDNEVIWLRGISRGRELARERGWADVQ